MGSPLGSRVVGSTALPSEPCCPCLCRVPSKPGPAAYAGCRATGRVRGATAARTLTAQWNASTCRAGLKQPRSLEGSLLSQAAATAYCSYSMFIGVFCNLPSCCGVKDCTHSSPRLRKYLRKPGPPTANPAASNADPPAN